MGDSNIKNKGGMFRGKLHSEGGIPLVVKGSGQSIEVEKDEPLIPSEAMKSKSIKKVTGTNVEILHKLNKEVGAKGMNDKATEVSVGDAIVCRKSAYDKTKRTYIGTPKQIVSAINESGGCKEIEKGGKSIEPDGTVRQYDEGGKLGDDYKVIKSQCGNFDIYVDVEDYDWLVDYAKSKLTNNGKSANGIASGWCVSKQIGKRNYYATKGRRIDNKIKTVKMHRLILGITDPKILIDHIDGNSLNNRKNNLRIVNNGGNRQNSVKIKMGTSKYKGVVKTKDGFYIARITFNGSLINLGRFKTEDEAGIAYNQGAKKYFGVYANLNNINNFKNGGIMNDVSEINNRWDKKKKQIEELANNIRSLNININKTLRHDNFSEKDSLTALVIAILLNTSERIGNEDSADKGRYGVTGFKKKHIKIDGNKISLNYVGKSSVEHEKSFSNELIAKALKKAIKNSPSNYIFCTSDGFRIKADRVNRFLEDYNISAKSIRGYNANNLISKKLEKIEIPDTEKKRRTVFNKVAKQVAQKIGHGTATLKKHYMMPELSDNYIFDKEIIDVKEATIFATGGELVGESLEKRVKNRLTDNRISLKDLAEIVGREPNYPNEYVGDLKLQKCFLLPYYRLL
jgi:DNA topoisomerase IB